MKKSYYADLKKSIQAVIDCIVVKNIIGAQIQFQLSSELLDELLDRSVSDEDLIKISHYQVLLNQLHRKLVSKLE